MDRFFPVKIHCWKVYEARDLMVPIWINDGSLTWKDVVEFNPSIRVGIGREQYNCINSIQVISLNLSFLLVYCDLPLFIAW